MTGKNTGFKIVLLEKFFKEKFAWYGLLFFISSAVFLFFQIKTRYFYGFDSYYHAKMGVFMMENGPFTKEFPWMYFTFQREHFVNPFFLFHLYLGVWQKVFVFNTLMGCKVAMAALMGLCFVWSARVSERAGKLGAVIGVLFLFSVLTPDVYIRLLLVRSHVLSLFLLVAGIDAFFRKRWLVAGILAMAYTYSYVAFFLFPVVIITGAVFMSIDEKKVVWKPAVYVLSGMLAGVLINPSFPHNVEYLYNNLFRMALTNSPLAGMEWLPISTRDFITRYWYVLALMFGSVVTVFLNRMKYSWKCVFLFSIACFFMAMTMYSKRFIEYWPFMVSLAVSFIFIETIQMYNARRAVKNAIIAIVGVCLFCYGTFEMVRSYREARSIIPMAELSEVMTVLDKKAEPGDIVYSEDWEMFSPMFYLCDKVYYLQGLDPGMMRLAHPGLFALWQGINTGAIQGDVYPAVREIYRRSLDPETGAVKYAMETGKTGRDIPHVIREVFKSRWILLTHGHYGETYDMRPLLAKYPDQIELIAGNKYFSLYKVKDI
ncbi:MAG: hypothetical protein ABIA77_06000 [Candidatus Omnitrophota bacterium]